MELTKRYLKRKPSGVIELTLLNVGQTPLHLYDTVVNPGMIFSMDESEARCLLGSLGDDAKVSVLYEREVMDENNRAAIL